MATMSSGLPASSVLEVMYHEVGDACQVRHVDELSLPKADNRWHGVSHLWTCPCRDDMISALVAHLP